MHSMIMHRNQTFPLGNSSYDDVYLDQASTDDDDDTDTLEANINISLKPLMSPRKPKVAMRMSRGPTVWQVRQQKRCLKAFYVIMMMLIIFLVVFVLFRITHDYEDSIDKSEQQEVVHVTVLPNGTTIKIPALETEVEVLSCTHFEVEDVWVQNIPMLQTESAFRLVDVNTDGTLDVIMGFSTAVNGYFADANLLCAIYYNGDKPCFGGVMALDGRTGDRLWVHHTKQEIFAINCNVDIDNDGVKDCLCAGRTGLFQLLSGATGDAIWIFADDEVFVSISNLYTAQFIQDMNGDGIQDVLNIHGGDPFREKGAPVSHIGKLVIFSGADGHVISHVSVPDNVESYYSPQVYYKKGGKPMVLFGSGGETQSGSLWVMPLHDIIKKTTKNAKALYTDKVKGILTPPVLVDLNRDNVEDIVMTMFNSTVIAFDGQTHKQLWNYSRPASESYSTPSAGYYNDDDIPDFMINNNIGPGYPIYYSSEVTILDGRNGQPLLPTPIRTAGSAQSSPVTISMEGHGHDAFVYFNLDCLGHEGEGGEYKTQDSSKASVSQVDFCRQRYNAETYSRLFALNQHMQIPGQSVYNSVDRKSDEYQYKVNSTLIAKAYLDAHPEVLKVMRMMALKGRPEDDEELETTVKEEWQSLQATSVPTLTQELYDQLPKPETLSPRQHVSEGTTVSSDEEDSLSYNALLDKLQKYLGVNLKDEDLSGKDAEDSSDVAEPADGYMDYANVPRPQKRPAYERQEWSGRYTPPYRQYSNPPTADNYDQNQRKSFYNLLTKYPWLLQAVYNDNREQTAPPNYSSKKRMPDARLPQRQWGRGRTLWNRQRRETSTENENKLKKRPHKKNVGQVSTSQDRNLNLKEKMVSKTLKPHKRQGYSKHRLNHNTYNWLHAYEERPPLKRHFQSRIADKQRLQDKSSSKRAKHRFARHAGLHNAGGTMRLLSTGSLAPPLEGADSSRSIDIVYAVYWFYPVDQQIILPDEEKCLNKWTANETQRFIAGNKYFGMDHDAYEHESMEHCIRNDHQTFKEKSKILKTLNPLDIYPFNVHGGEMTVYRLRLTCQCGVQQDNPKKRCAKILPYKQQQWAGYMGTYANSHFQQHKSPS